MGQSVESNEPSTPSSSAVSWQLRTRRLDFQMRPAIMGIVNVTPDSFSDGGQFVDCQAAVDHALRMEDAGADIIDIGGESTRPYSQPVTAEEELRRVVPVLEQLQGRIQAAISIDTSKADVAQAAIELGAEIINDVTGLEGDPRMVDMAVRTEVGVCAMHMQGTPQTMQDAPHYDDVVEEVFSYLAARREQLISHGIAPQRICLDPGIGFGKTHAHNWQLVRSCRRFLALPHPILIGHSRKGFITKVSGSDRESRLGGTLAVSLFLASCGMHVLRVHDVAATVAAVRCQRECRQ
ncbi:MAG: dihydropteroate synthase [Pirellulaceae bacterium]|nr:MAG: dihydropteroate synthase [Pirellulaceae bacterium]